jgi:mxaL protein
VDGKPVSRLAHAKHALRETLLKLPCGSRVGWGLFTEYRSFLLFAPVEVCANLNELRSTLDGIDGRMAWAGNSEVAKGLYGGYGIARQLPGVPALVFVTDGHEAPPVNPRFRPVFTHTVGEVQGLVVGTGQLTPSPIPKVDPLGRPLGFWGADDVLQTDPRSQGRGGSVAGEQMVAAPGEADAAPLPGATPGSEHLSALREGYLRLLAEEIGLGFHRLQEADDLAAAMMTPALARPVPARADLRVPLVVLAALAVLAAHWPKRRIGWRLRWPWPWRRAGRLVPRS